MRLHHALGCVPLSHSRFRPPTPCMCSTSLPSPLLPISPMLPVYPGRPLTFVRRPSSGLSRSSRGTAPRPPMRLSKPLELRPLSST